MTPPKRIMTVSGQDPDAGGGCRLLPAYRQAVPGVHSLGTLGHPLAAMAGLQVLMKGASAIDAAVVVRATLNVMDPQLDGIGGNGFTTISEKKTGKVYARGMTGAGRNGAETCQSHGRRRRHEGHRHRSAERHRAGGNSIRVARAIQSAGKPRVRIG